MPRWKERLYLKRLIAQADEAISFLSGARKPERERSTCTAFLRCLGITFSADEIVSFKADPPDVIFRNARFEVVEILDEDRRRHDEWKVKRDRRARAKRLGDLLEPFIPSEALPYASLLDRINATLGKKSRHYGPNECANFDALVYVDLQNKTLDPASQVPSFDNLVAQGWRSVSMLIPPYSHVLHAGESAPELLRAVVCQARREWANLDPFD